ncbi:type II toxin-antitoxin system death-on-curing family toxin [Pseudonocardia sp.]|uniref:type II toxin-antitoxin system death-on-curing family toxin n=1 Tax=Pseudonocardia sp. TaxID=60912 RepID=UPI00260234D1|nr:type II toxin-antitoxin system death-on-curing family toxin [Pseudonocardia sp.]
MEQLLRIADAAIEGDVVVRDVGLLESALARPQTTLFGEDAYRGLHTKAAALLHSLAGNHALIDGNKRLAWAATAVFLGINGHRVETTDGEVVEFVLAVAAGEPAELPDIAERLQAWSAPGRP